MRQFFPKIVLTPFSPGALSKDASLKIWNDLYGDASVIKDKNNQWQPVLHPESATVKACCKGDTSLPMDFNEIHPASSGWRNWNYGTKVITLAGEWTSRSNPDEWIVIYPNKPPLY